VEYNYNNEDQQYGAEKTPKNLQRITMSIPYIFNGAQDNVGEAALDEENGHCDYNPNNI